MFKQALLVAGVLSLATAASALELTNPFYVPTKGTIASTTTYDFETTTVKNKGADLRVKEYDHYVSEALSYGLTDNLSLDASIANTFAKGTFYGITDREDKNIAFTAGSTWNVLTGPAKLQVSAAYGQDEAKDGEFGAYKYVTGAVKAGYTMGIYTPYVSAGIEKPLFQHQGDDKEPIYTGKAAVYAFCPRIKTSVDTGFTVTHAEEVEYTGYSYDLEVAYHVTKNVAVSAFGSYLIDGNAKYSTDVYGNKVGLKLRAAF